MSFRTFFPLVTVLVSFLCSCRTERAGPGGGIGIRDDLERTVGLSAPPRRIVSLAPSITETVFALERESLLVGVTDYCDYPDGATSIESVGGIANPSAERILELRPDLVLMTVSGNQRGDFERLTSLGLTVFVTNPRNLDGILKSIQDIGSLTSAKACADSIIGTLKARRDSLSVRSNEGSGSTVLVLLSLRPIIAAGSDTFIDELIRLCNGTNAAASAPTQYPVLSREEVLRARPDVLLATDDVASTPDEILGAYPEWYQLPAVKRGRVVLVDADIVSRPGPRIIDGLAALSSAIHSAEKKPSELK